MTSPTFEGVDVTFSIHIFDTRPFLNQGQESILTLRNAFNRFSAKKSSKTRFPAKFGSFSLQYTYPPSLNQSQGSVFMRQQAGKTMSQYPFLMSQWAAGKVLIDVLKGLEVRLSMRHPPFPGKILPWCNAGVLFSWRLTVEANACEAE